MDQKKMGNVKSKTYTLINVSARAFETTKGRFDAGKFMEFEEPEALNLLGYEGILDLVKYIRTMGTAEKLNKEKMKLKNELERLWKSNWDMEQKILGLEDEKWRRDR